MRTKDYIPSSLKQKTGDWIIKSLVKRGFSVVQIRRICIFTYNRLMDNGKKICREIKDSLK